MPKTVYIDLTEDESKWLRRLVAGQTGLSDCAFDIHCKLTDSMRVNDMGIDHETNHPATTGVEKYAEEGISYYTTAARAQWAIGIGSALQAIGTWAIVAMLAMALFGCAGIRHANTIKAVVEQTNQPVKSVSGSFKSKQFRVEFFDQPSQ